MQRKTLLTICAAAVVATSALGLAMARPATLGSPTNWRGTTSQDWNVGSNWSNGVPHAGDIVNIPSGVPAGYKGDPIISNADGLAGDLTIAGPRTVTVTGKKLTLDGSTQAFNGPLILSNSTSKVEFTFAQASGWVGLTGSGGIEGKDASAEVGLNDSKIDNDSVIHGILTVKKVGGDTATFKNGATGIVRANVNGVLAFAAGLTLDDDSGAQWQTQSNASAVLQLESGLTFVDSSPQLVGNFLVDDDATLDIDLTIVTSGTMTHTNGTVDTTVNTSIFFKATGNDPDFLCNTICEAP